MLFFVSEVSTIVGCEFWRNSHALVTNTESASIRPRYDHWTTYVATGLQRDRLAGSDVI